MLWTERCINYVSFITQSFYMLCLSVPLRFFFFPHCKMYCSLIGNIDYEC